MKRLSSSEQSLELFDRDSPQEYSCILPNELTVSASALRALEDSLIEKLPSGLTLGIRESVLCETLSNKVPESVIVHLALGDVRGEYISLYSANVKRRLKRAALTPAVVKDYYTDSYQRYVCKRRRIPCVDLPGTREPARSTVALLFYPAIQRNPLTQKPFRLQKDNKMFVKCWAEIWDALNFIQKYVYYMRPDEITTPSLDTSARLELLFGYVKTLYMWAMWLMDLLDTRIVSNKFGTRVPISIDNIFSNLTEVMGSLSSDKWMSTALLCRSIEHLLSSLIHISSLWTCCQWRETKHGEMLRPIVSIVALVSLLHHHCQYIINITFNGYARWLEGGLGNPMLRSAIRQQKRFEHYLGGLFPSTRPTAWGELEFSIRAWFELALAKSMVIHGSLLKKSIVSNNVLEPLCKPRHTQIGERHDTRFTRSTSMPSSSGHIHSTLQNNQQAIVPECSSGQLSSIATALWSADELQNDYVEMKGGVLCPAPQPADSITPNSSQTNNGTASDGSPTRVTDASLDPTEVESSTTVAETPPVTVAVESVYVCRETARNKSPSSKVERILRRLRVATD